MKSSWRYQQFLDDGRIVEKKFSDHLKEYGNVFWSTKNEDIWEHWDLKLIPEDPNCPLIIWGRDNLITTYDVKSIKSKSRGKLSDDSIHYIEFVNVDGKTGWLYGKSDYISFETNQDWLVIDRLDLIKFAEKYKNQIPVIKPYKDPKPYKLYYRQDRKDRFIMVETTELRKITKYIIKK
jgi:hypothetical protein